MSGTYAIEQRQLHVVGIGRHDYWVLRGPDGAVISEIHGLATDLTDPQNPVIKPIGLGPLFDKAQIQAHEFNATSFIRLSSGGFSVYYQTKGAGVI